MKKSSLLEKGLIIILGMLLMTILSFSITQTIALAADGLFSDTGDLADSNIQKKKEKLLNILFNGLRMKESKLKLSTSCQADLTS